jgi:hypothetical protein
MLSAFLLQQLRHSGPFDAPFLEWLNAQFGRDVVLAALHRLAAPVEH